MAKSHDWLIENIDLLLMLAITAIVFVLSSIGKLSSQQVPALSLSILFGLTFFVGTRFYKISNTLENNSKNLKDITDRVKGTIEARVIEGNKEFLEVAIPLIQKSKQYDTTHFSPINPRELYTEFDSSYWDIINEKLKQGKGEFVLRRVINIDNPNKIDWINESIKNCNNSPDYHIRSVKDDDKACRLGLLVIDKKYTFLMGPYSQDKRVRFKYVFINNEEITRVFSEYFQELWNASTILKDGSNFKEDELNHLEKEGSSKKS